MIACEGWNEISGPSLLHPSGTMGQGVYAGGDVAKGFNPVTAGKPKRSQPPGEERPSKRAEITRVKPEIPRSMPGQGEANGNVGGSPKLR